MSHSYKPKRPGLLGRLFNSLLKRLGLSLYRRKPDFIYAPREYGKAYWKKIDIKQLEPFSTLASKVIEDERTLLYFDRLYSMYQALENSLPLAREGMIAEVGVYKGGGLRFLAEAATQLGYGERTIFALDTFEGHPDRIDHAVDGDHLVGDFGNTSLESVQQYLGDRFPCRLIQGPVEQTCHQLNGSRFAFVHLDVDLYSGTLAALQFFSERMIPGGTIIVDDYGFLTCEGAMKATREFLQTRPPFYHLHLLTGQCLLVKIQRN